MSAPVFPSLGPPQWPVRLTRIGLWAIGAGLALALISGPLNRFGLADFRVALLTLAAGLVPLVVGTVLTIIALLGAAVQRVAIPRVTAALGIIVGLVVIGYLVSWVGRARSVPPIHEISTDLTDPPAFVVITEVRRRLPSVNPPEYIRQMRGLGGTMIDVPEMQRVHYPDIEPLQLAVPPGEALNRARESAQKLGWQIVADVPAEGRLEATDSTAFFGFKDDVVVRVRANDGGSRVDARSKSRVGLGDVGTNARRIRAFMKLMGSG